MKTFLVIATALTLSACASTGQNLPQNKGSQFQLGRTTYQQILTALGEPAESKLHPDGSRSIQYFRSQSQERAESVIPLVGGFVGSTEVESSFVSLSFTRDGLLQHYSAVTGKTSTSTSLSGGQRP